MSKVENNTERLNRLAKDSIKKCKECNIPIDETATIKLNTRAKKRYGVCRKRNGSFVIEISVFLFDSTDKQVQETILHEYLHTCPNCFNHGNQWNRYANVLNKKYDFNIKRVSSRSEKGLGAFTDDDYTYILKCSNPDCPNVIRRMKKTKVIQYYSRYRCGGCGSSLIKIKG